MSTFSETRRQIVHMTMSGFALLLRVLTWWQAALLAAVALAFNAAVLPRLAGRTLFRPAEVSRGIPLGILLYPLAVLSLILAFPGRLDPPHRSFDCGRRGNRSKVDGVSYGDGRDWGQRGARRRRFAAARQGDRQCCR